MLLLGAARGAARGRGGCGRGRGNGCGRCGTYVVISKEKKKKEKRKNLQIGPYDVSDVVWAHFRSCAVSTRKLEPRYVVNN